MLFHHIALRVPDAEVAKAWLQTMFNFKVEREFKYLDLDFVWMKPPSSEKPIVEIVSRKDGLVDGSQNNEMKSVDTPGFHHICLEVDNLGEAVKVLKRKGANVVVEAITGAEGSGVRHGAFILDPWGNSYELVEILADKIFQNSF